MNRLEDAGRPTDQDLPHIAPAVLRQLACDLVDSASDYGRLPIRRPQTSWGRRLVPVAAIAAAGLIAAIVLAPAPNAEAAGWLPVPTMVTGTTQASLGAECQQMMQSDAPVVLVEQRGASSFIVLGDTSECLNATGPGLPFPLTTGGQNRLPAQAPTGNEVQVIHADSLGMMTSDMNPNDPPDPQTSHGYMGVTGRVGPDVRTIVIHTAGQPDITASLHDGWFAAWWPSLTRPASMTVTTTTDTYQQDL